MSSDPNEISQRAPRGLRSPSCPPRPSRPPLPRSSSPAAASPPAASWRARPAPPVARSGSSTSPRTAVRCGRPSTAPPPWSSSRRAPSTSLAAQVQAILDAIGEPATGPHLVLVTGFSLGHGLAARAQHARAARRPRRAEELVRRSGVPYTIVRPTWLTSDPPGRYAVTLTQDPLADGMIARADLAAVCLAAIAEPAHGARRSRCSPSRAPRRARGRRCSLRLTAGAGLMRPRPSTPGRTRTPPTRSAGPCRPAFTAWSCST